MWQILTDTNLAQFTELFILDDYPENIPVKRLIVAYDRVGQGRPTEVYEFNQSPNALAALQYLWIACFDLGEVYSLRVFDAGDVEVVYI